MPALEVRDFDGDVAALAALAYDTLEAERGAGPWLDLNRPEAAHLLFAEVPDPRFLIGVYHGARLVAFIANLPRRYRLDGRTYLAAIPTMLAARRDYRGAVFSLFGECLRRNREFGADFALFYLERGTRSARLFRQYMRRSGPVHTLRAMHAVVRVIDLAGAVEAGGVGRLLRTGARLIGLERPPSAPQVPGAVRPYGDGDLAAIDALMQRRSDRHCLVRAFGRPALARRLHTGEMTDTLVYERAGAVAGYANFTVHETLSRRGRQRWAWLDFVGWDGLSGAEKQALLAGLWQAGRERGCVGILEWSKGYYGQGPLYRAGYIPYPLGVDAAAWVTNPSLSLRDVRGLCEQVV